MLVLVLGVVLFALGHSLKIFGGLRAAIVGLAGEGGAKGAATLLSLAGIVAMVYGYHPARAALPELWYPPVWTRHVAALLMLFAFILLMAGNLPAGRIKAALKHPMLASVKVWALAHLLANGSAADVILFGGLLAWAVVDRISLKKRARAGLIADPVAGPITNDVIAVVVGTALYAVFAFYAHEWLFGVRPFG